MTTLKHLRPYTQIFSMICIGFLKLVGVYVGKLAIIFPTSALYRLFTSLSKDLEFPLTLRNRIIWTFGHGLNSTNRFSGRHEVILWFTKGEQKIFNLDEVRVPQKYPGKSPAPVP